jgi:hypothetical protein
MDSHDSERMRIKFWNSQQESVTSNTEHHFRAEGPNTNSKWRCVTVDSMTSRSIYSGFKMFEPIVVMKNVPAFIAYRSDLGIKVSIPLPKHDNAFRLKVPRRQEMLNTSKDQ